MSRVGDWRDDFFPSSAAEPVAHQRRRANDLTPSCSSPGSG
ncbi:hypothetical protein ACFQ6V_07375 [Streptomyces roseifaciens]